LLKRCEPLAWAELSLLAHEDCAEDALLPEVLDHWDWAEDLADDAWLW
jgi:hypothetical protein